MACHRIRGPKSRPPANPQKGASGSPKPTFSRDRPAHPHSPQTVQHLGQQRLLPTTPSPHHPPPPTSATQAQLAKATGATVGAQDDARANKQAPRRAGRRLPDTPTNPSTRTDLPNHFWESPQNSQRPAHSPPPQTVQTPRTTAPGSGCSLRSSASTTSRLSLVQPPRRAAPSPTKLSSILQTHFFSHPLSQGPTTHPQCPESLLASPSPHFFAIPSLKKK